MKKNGAEIFIESLIKEGVDTIFGYPGGAVLPIYDALYKAPLRHILVRHEQGAVHMADGYARSSGRPGVVVVTSGPGATNTVTGIANACMDSIPVVVFTGQVPTTFIGNDAFQEADITGITRPCTKHNFLVRNVDNLGQTIKEAFHIARSGRPGPVLIDLPKDVIQGVTDDATLDYPLSFAEDVVGPIEEKCVEALALIRGAKRPLILSGGGVLLGRAWEGLRTFAKNINCPVTSSLMGLRSEERRVGKECR